MQIKDDMDQTTALHDQLVRACESLLELARLGEDVTSLLAEVAELAREVTKNVTYHSLAVTKNALGSN